MKKLLSLTLTLMLFCLLIGGANAATLFTTVLTGDQEAVPNNSPYIGVAAFSLAGGVFSGDVVFNGLTTAFTAAHVHQAPPGVAGPIVFALQVDPNNPFHLFGSGNLTGAQVSALKAGNFYVNIHSTTYPAGEIRGQFPAVPEPGSLATLLTMGGLSALGILRRRKA